MISKGTRAGRLSARGWVPQNLSYVRALQRATGSYRVALRALVFDGEAQVRESVPEAFSEERPVQMAPSASSLEPATSVCSPRRLAVVSTIPRKAIRLKWFTSPPDE
jgi:hypothetical protein